MNHYSPLRYPGGKGKLAEYIQLVFEKNLLLDGCYVEPYAGGAAVALSVLINEYASKIVINDLDRSIYAFWYSALNETEQLCKLISDTKVSISTWKQMKHIQSEKKDAGLIELGFSTFFLNRTNRSGIIKGGVIGGNNQEGNFKIDARYNKKELIERIERIANYKSRILLYNLDAIDLIKTISGILPPKTLFMFDPPYYVKGKGLYVNYYSHQDHEEVSKVVKTLNKFKWIVSYDDVPEIRSLYKENNKFKYSLNYSVVNSTSGIEIIIYSDNLRMPRFVQ